MRHHYIIGTVRGLDGGTGYSMAAIPTLHATYQSAHKEASRLARKEPGATFVIFQPMFSFRVPPSVEVERKVIHMEAQGVPETDATDSIPY